MLDCEVARIVSSLSLLYIFHYIVVSDGENLVHCTYCENSCGGINATSAYIVSSSINMVNILYDISYLKRMDVTIWNSVL